MIKRSFILLLAVAAAFVSCAPENEPNTAEFILSEMHDPTSDYVLVISHRGDWRNYPENSIPAIESVIRMGVDIMELDLKMTKDSVLVLCHDHTIDRTMNGKGKVSDYTLAELKNFKLKRAHGVTTDDIRIPTLREALEVCKDRIVVNVDHAQNYYDEVLKITEELGVTGQVLMKGTKPVAMVAEDMSKYENNLLYMPIININREKGQELFNEYKETGTVPLAYEVCWSELNSDVTECMDYIRKSGSKVWANTIWGSLCAGMDDDKAIDDPHSIYGPVVDMGVTMIQTDRPQLLIDYLRSRGLHK